MLKCEIDKDRNDGDEEPESSVASARKRKKTDEKCFTYGTGVEDLTFQIESENSDLDLGNRSEPIDYFRLFFDDGLLSFIHIESMRYSGNVFTLEELKVVIGVLVASGVVSQSRRRDYWSSYERKKSLDCKAYFSK